jgi:acyl-CoA synthetase (AMP-forming)/AMP-acid ligase II
VTNASDTWNYADCWEHIARRLPDAPAQEHRGQVYSWSEFDRRADSIAATLLAAGVRRQDKFAQYLYNGPEYLESVFAAFKIGLAPVNTNYRYTVDELVHIWDDSDSVAVVFHGCFVDKVAEARERVPRVRTWLWVDDGSGPCPSWAVDYSVACADSRSAVAPWPRQGDDLLLIYTGGTTGMPKGVMWRQEDLMLALDSGNRRSLPPLPDASVLDARSVKPGPRNLPAAPLMHGTGLFNAMSNLMVGGCIVTLAGRNFDPIELLDTVSERRVNSMSFVGDAFGKPILRALDAEPDRWDLTSLRVIVSSGVMFSTETKAGLLRHAPNLTIIDSLGSSEAIGMAQNTTSASGDVDSAASTTARFRLGPNTKVLTEDGREVAPGSDELGRVAIKGHTPIGYYKDEVKSASTFQVFDGVRWSIPGDWARVDSDGVVHLLGRGSQCINTGGEKVYPEEVEEALKTHPDVADAAVVGVPDDRFGQAVTALVEPLPGRSIDTAELVTFVRRHLAAYKSPKHVITVDSIGRAGNGKLDYKSLTARAVAALG